MTDSDAAPRHRWTWEVLLVLGVSLGQSAADLVAAYKAFGGGWAGTEAAPAERN